MGQTFGLCRCLCQTRSIFGQTYPIATASQMPSHASIVAIDLWGIGVRECAGETSDVWKLCGPMLRIQRLDRDGVPRPLVKSVFGSFWRPFAEFSIKASTFDNLRHPSTFAAAQTGCAINVVLLFIAHMWKQNHALPVC